MLPRICDYVDLRLVAIGCVGLLHLLNTLTRTILAMRIDLKAMHSPTRGHRKAEPKRPTKQKGTPALSAAGGADVQMVAPTPGGSISVLDI